MTVSHLVVLYTENILHSFEKPFLSGGLGNKCIFVTCDSPSDITELNKLFCTLRTLQRVARTPSYMCLRTLVSWYCLHILAKLLSPLSFLSTGCTGLHTDTCTRGFIPVHSLFYRWYEEQRNILMSVYCLTSSDRALSFNGKKEEKGVRNLL